MAKRVERCDSCGDRLYVGSWPFCRGKGSHDTVRSSLRTGFEPIVYYESPTGDVAPPGAANDIRADRHLTEMGFKKREIRNGREYEKWQKEQRNRLKVEQEHQARQRDETWGVAKRASRGQLYHDMQTMTPAGRDLAMAAIERSNARKRDPREPEPRIAAMEYDRNSMEVQYRGRR